MMDVLDLYNHRHNFQALHNCSISVVCDLFHVLLHLGLVRASEILFVPLLRFGLGAAFWLEIYRWEFYPTLTHNFYKCTHRVPLIYKSYRKIVVNFVYTSVTNGSCP